MKKTVMPKPDDGYTKARAAMPHVMALNKDPSMGLKNNRQPKPGISNVTAFAKGGKVCAPKAKKMAAGGAARTRLKEPMPKPIKKVPMKGG